MQLLEKPAKLLDILKGFDVFAGQKDEDLNWLIERAEYRKYDEGQFIFSKGEPTDYLIILVDGDLVIRFQQGNEWQELGRMESGETTGVLPYSRMKEASGYGAATRDSYLLALHKKHFQDMACYSYELTRAFVHEMTNRVRSFTTLRTQNEKLMALGKMSAGLAHELNNPASAMTRSAEELYSKIHSTPEKFKSVISMRITPEQTDAVNEILFGSLQNMGASEDMSLMEKEEATDELLDWLDEHEIDNADDLAETFVDFRISPEELDTVNEIIKGESLASILWWIESTLSLEKLVHEIQESADRIEKLVKSVKEYSHMDRARDRTDIDIHESLKSTVTMLKHKLKKKQIQLEKELEPELPKVKAFGGELNQVWTNIIDNAIDALEPGGRLLIKTFRDRDYVRINFTDNGPGIPEDMINRIFEPFFTTKKLGEGTGMGLEIVQRIVNRNKGIVEVDSKEGEGTTFSFCFPASIN
jgi:signal transduction histidine kinase